jgi:hypothetical protein
MPIEREDGFLQSHDLAHVSCLGVETRRLAACVGRIKAGRIRGVFGSRSFGFTGSDLDFLAELPWLEAVWFFDVTIRDIDGLYALKKLRFFGVHPRRPPVDFSRFPELRTVVLNPVQAGDRGLERLRKVEQFHLWHYKAKDDRFASLAFPPSASEVRIVWANLSSLASLPPLPRLRNLTVARCRNLRDLGDLAGKYPKLEQLVVDACGRVSRGEGERAVRRLRRLRHAYVQGVKLV